MRSVGSALNTALFVNGLDHINILKAQWKEHSSNIELNVPENHTRLPRRYVVEV